jgi:alkylation response protein AidB-like acyl-CoA dehydrogenase
MRLEETPEQQALRAELRTYFERTLTPEVREGLGPHPGEHCGPAYRAYVRQLGTDGWLGIGWPNEFGGQGRSPLEQYIFFEECDRARAPFPLVTLNTVGPTLMRYGSEEQKAEFLPRILRGEIHFAIGYTEPGAGTDLASLTTRAVREGDDFVVNGQKIFTTGAHDADYLWLAARTDSDAPKHKGISVFIVETSAPGFKVTPIETLDDGRTNACYFADVRVPASSMVGGENEGWRLITTQLNHERVALSRAGRVIRAYEDTLAWAKETGAIERPWVRLTLARVRAGLDAMRLLNWRIAWEMTRDHPSAADSSAAKVYGTEFMGQAYRLLLEVIGEAGAIKEGSPGAVLRGELEHDYRAALVFTFGGGVNEVQREIVATAGLGLPRSRR